MVRQVRCEDFEKSNIDKACSAIIAFPEPQAFLVSLAGVQKANALELAYLGNVSYANAVMVNGNIGEAFTRLAIHEYSHS